MNAAIQETFQRGIVKGAILGAGVSFPIYAVIALQDHIVKPQDIIPYLAKNTAMQALQYSSLAVTYRILQLFLSYLKQKYGETTGDAKTLYVRTQLFGFFEVVASGVPALLTFGTTPSDGNIQVLLFSMRYLIEAQISHFLYSASTNATQRATKFFPYLAFVIFACFFYSFEKHNNRFPQPFQDIFIYLLSD